MSITRAQFEAQSKSIEQTKIAALIAAEATRQSGLAAAAGLTDGPFTAQVAAANAATFTARNNAEIARQQSLMVQRDLLRDSGDRSPF